MNQHDTRVMERLMELGEEHRKKKAELQQLRVERDALILVAWRRGISLRLIADAARVHYTRIQQITRAVDEAAREGNMTHAHPMGDPDDDAT